MQYAVEGRTMYRHDLIEQFAREERQKLLTQAHQQRELRRAFTLEQSQSSRRHLSHRLAAFFQVRRTVRSS